MTIAVSGRAGGYPVVLSNSLGADMSMWDPQMPALSDWFRVIRYERRGASSIEEDAREVLGILDDLGVRQASFCGVSLGGMTGMWLAAYAPDRIHRLVLACTSPYLGPPEMWARRRAVVTEGGTAAVAEQVVARWFTPAFSEREQFVRMIASTSPVSYAASCSAIEAMDLRDALARIAAPTLVIAGADDPATPVEHAQVIARAIRDARLEVIEGAAHLANVEQPGRFTELLLEHLLGSNPYERGITIRRAVLGDDYVDRALAAGDEVTEQFQRYITESAWGTVWWRPTLDRRTRSLVTLAVLTALGRDHEIAVHVEAARRNGLSAVEIAEVLLHTSVYAGAPAANRAFAVARDVISRWPT